MVCLDTTFVIDLLRGDSKARLIAQNFDNSSESVFVTSPSIVEIVDGAFLSFDPNKEVKKIEELLSSIMVLDLNKENAFMAGKTEAQLKESGEVIEIEDIMIAAIAMTNNERLITRNVKHFSKIKDLKIESY